MYLVIEIQKTGDSIANIVTTHATRNEAESKLHAVLSAAAVSNVPKHAAVLLSEDGLRVMGEVYEHENDQ